MAGTRRRPGSSLIARLVAEPQRFGFFQAVRILELAARRSARPRGDEGENRLEPVRFRASPSLAFPATEIVELRPAEVDANAGARPAEMIVAFFGLTGSSGVLPHHYTAQVIRSVRSRSFALRDFLDLFNHRLIALFAAAWHKYRLPFTFERSSRPGHDPHSEILRGLVGLATEGTRERGVVGDEIFLHYSGLLSHYPRSAAGLEAVLAGYFARSVRVEQLCGRRIHLAPDEQTALGTSENPRGQFCELGVSATVGQSAWDVQGSFRLHFGPLDYAQFRSFMPDGDDLALLSELTRRYVGPALGFDVRLTLKKEDVPECRLTTLGAEAPRLGWNSWLKHRAFLSDPTDAVFAP
ncbi:MAG: tssG [Rhodospirillales bacterium]|nr:tssG [Rhodospirillales bacterium]